MPEPDAEARLEELRRAIDAVDREILGQLNARARLVTEVGRLKRAREEGVYHAARERDLVAALCAANPGPFPSAALAPVFREIISGTRSLEQRLRIAHLGPEGTFSHLAVRERFGALVTALPVPSIPEVFDAVERGRAELGMVPVENTTEGVVTQTLDVFARSTVQVCGELLLPVALHLLSRAERLEDVRRVVSHPQPLAQCRRWLDRFLPSVERAEVASTAAAAALAREQPDTAAIGSALLAEVAELRVLETGIQDRADNTTRFLVIGGEPAERSGDDLTLVVYTVSKGEPGALHRLLEPFARYRVNLTSIQSRPLEGKPWEYHFFIELEGHCEDDEVAKAMSEARSVAHSVRVLGSFPRGRLTPPGAA